MEYDLIALIDSNSTPILGLQEVICKFESYLLSYVNKFWNKWYRKGVAIVS